MARLNIQQCNFTAGEVSPRLIGRTDVDRYGNAVALMLNAYPVIHGGAKRRAGTKYLTPVKEAAKEHRLVPFVYSRDLAFMLVFGDSNIRVYPAGGGAMVVELASPYTEAMLPDIDYVQGADVMVIAHGSAPMQRLRRLESGTWLIEAVPFLTTPFAEIGYTPATTLTLSLATVGAGRTATAGAASFQPADVGRQITSGPGVATIVGYTSTTVVTVDISSAFAGTVLASGAWTIEGSPLALLIPSQKDPVGSVINLTAALSRAADLTLSAKTGAITVTASAGVFAGGDVGKRIYADNGIALITAFTDATHVNATVETDFASTSYAQGGYGITDSAWQAADVGAFVRLNGGLLKITAVTSASVARAQILQGLNNIVAAPAFSWSLERAVWSAVNGYPRTVTLHEQRLVAAGSTKYPQTIWGSRLGEYLDFTGGTNDDDGYSFTIASDEVNPISFLSTARNLIVHTYGGEFSLQGGVEKPITPTNVRIRAESNHGSRQVRPVTVAREAVFVQRAGRKVRAMGYRYDFDGYASPDLTVLAEHITEGGGVTQLAYQQEPDLILWAVRADGTLLSCTLDRDQQVIGWARHYTAGAVESVATIPNGDREETWLIAKRTVNGATVRYIEMVQETFEPTLPGAAYTGYPPAPDIPVYGYTVDCGASFDSVPGTDTFAVPHLIGREVDILADGAVQPRQIVPGSGNVVLPRTAHRALIGLPFRTQITLLTPEVGTQSGTAQGTSMRTAELSLRLLDTVGAKVMDDAGNEQVIPFRNFGPVVLDQPPEERSGIVRVELLGWARGANSVSIVQDQPLPMHVLAAIRKFTTNEG